MSDIDDLFSDAELHLSNLDKIYWPGISPSRRAVTKKEMLDYYEAIAPVMIPHLRGRPASMLRCPDGVEGEQFFMKNAPASRPSWVDTVGIWAETSARVVQYVLINDVRTLLWAANLGAIEFHISPAQAADLEHPTYLVFDLDPGEPADASDCAKIALMLRDEVMARGMQSFIKSSGSKGLHVVVPTRVPSTFKETEEIAHQIANALAAAHPDRVVTRMRRAERVGKVLIDWSQNQRHKTTVAPYSVRARKRPWVSAPLEWAEVEKAADMSDASLLFFEMSEVVKRVEIKGDLFEPMVSDSS